MLARRLVRFLRRLSSGTNYESNKPKVRLASEKKNAVFIALVSPLYRIPQEQGGLSLSLGLLKKKTRPEGQASITNKQLCTDRRVGLLCLSHHETKKGTAAHTNSSGPPFTVLDAHSPNPVVGSSANSRLGHVSSSVAIESRRFSPPEMPLESPPPMRESRTPSSRRSRSTYPPSTI